MEIFTWWISVGGGRVLMKYSVTFLVDFYVSKILFLRENILKTSYFIVKSQLPKVTRITRKISIQDFYTPQNNQYFTKVLLKNFSSSIKNLTPTENISRPKNFHNLIKMSIQTDQNHLRFLLLPILLPQNF